MVPINWDIERQSWKRLYNYGPQKKKEKTKKTYEIQKLGWVFFFFFGEKQGWVLVSMKEDIK